MLTTAQSTAIHCSLVMGLPELEAAKHAGIPESEASVAIFSASQSFRGKVIDFTKWLDRDSKFRGDSLLFTYEVHLARLEYQHNECLKCWRRSMEHADKLHEQFPDPVDDEGKIKKPYVGDIRFLQLARNIRREMEKVQKAIAEHLEAVSKRTVTNEAPATVSQAVEPAPSPPAPAISSASPVKKLSPTAQELFSTARDPLPPSNPAPSAWRPKEIPSIQPPPRKKDKYAGVNR